MQKKILLIEDEEFIRELYVRQLKLAGFNIEGFGTGKEGLDAATANPTYDIVLLDIMLPDTNGIDILKQLKQNPKTQKMPVVLLTNLGQESVLKEGFALGAKGCLIKASYTPNQIVEEVKKMLSDNTQNTQSEEK